MKNLMRNRKLARSIADMGWGEFRRQLTYKAIMYETNVIVADRFFPSSKLCSCCGRKKDELSLSEREFVCSGCGLVIDRDVNAAVNLEKLGQAMAEVTPVDKKALALLPSHSRTGKRRKKGETGLDEAGTQSCSLVGM